MGCSCKGIKLAIAGILFIVNDQGWLWSANAVSGWMLLGIILLVLGVIKAIWPCCPVHGKSATKTVGKKRK